MIVRDGDGETGEIHPLSKVIFKETLGLPRVSQISFPEGTGKAVLFLLVEILESKGTPKMIFVESSEFAPDVAILASPSSLNYLNSGVRYASIKQVGTENKQVEPSICPT